MADVRFRDLIQAQETLTDTNITYWLQHTFLTPTWWILLGLFIIPWIAWWLLFDRAQASRLYLNGLLVMILSSLMDAIGSELGMWGYPNELIPLLPRALVFDFGLVPVTYMLMCQYFYRWVPFIWCSLVVSLLFAFAGEPLTMKMGIYQPLKWKSMYSFPVYFFLAIFVRSIVIAIVRLNMVKEPS